MFQDYGSPHIPGPQTVRVMPLTHAQGPFALPAEPLSGTSLLQLRLHEAGVFRLLTMAMREDQITAGDVEAARLLSLEWSGLDETQVQQMLQVASDCIAETRAELPWAGISSAGESPEKQVESVVQDAFARIPTLTEQQQRGIKAIFELALKLMEAAQKRDLFAPPLMNALSMRGAAGPYGGGGRPDWYSAGWGNPGILRRIWRAIDDRFQALMDRLIGLNVVVGLVLVAALVTGILLIAAAVGPVPVPTVPATTGFSVTLPPGHEWKAASTSEWIASRDLGAEPYRIAIQRSDAMSQDELDSLVGPNGLSRMDAPAGPTYRVAVPAFGALGLPTGGVVIHYIVLAGGYTWTIDCTYLSEPEADAMVRTFAVAAPAGAPSSVGTLHFPQAGASAALTGGVRMGVIIVREMVGTSPTSWSDAANQAVIVASKTVRNIRVVEVVSSTARVENGEITEFRVQLKLHFEYEQ